MAPSDFPLVSVVIPCYNYGRFLAEAIESVRAQTYPAIEIVVVDDGSLDDTRTVAARYAGVRYIYQENQGLSAARNTGLHASRGHYLVFLDADDWLLPDALATNVQQLQQYPQAAFVAGAHTVVAEDTGKRAEVSPALAPDPYLHLLAHGNYIAMIAAVMFCRWALTDLQFDTSLKSCEDYDLYLAIARKYPVIQHHQQLAAYRHHSQAMSAAARLPTMLANALHVLHRQKAQLRSPAEVQAYRAGLRFWPRYYYAEMYCALVFQRVSPSEGTIEILRKQAPSLWFLYNWHLVKQYVKRKIKG